MAWPGGLSTSKASSSPFVAWIGRCSDGFGLSWRSDWPAWTIRASLALRCRGHGMVICGVTVSEIIASWPEIDDERTRILVVRIARSQRCIPLATAQEAKGEAARKLEEAIPLESAKKRGPFRRRMSQFQALDPKPLRPRHHGSNFP